MVNLTASSTALHAEYFVVNPVRYHWESNAICFSQWRSPLGCSLYPSMIGMYLSWMRAAFLSPNLFVGSPYCMMLGLRFCSVMYFSTRSCKSNPRAAAG